ncbi:IgGFc-binding protein [Myxococcota bacterium]
MQRYGVLVAAMVLAPACDDSPFGGDRLSPRVCKPGNMICNPDGSAEICAPDGRYYTPSYCPEGQICITSTCNGKNTFEPQCRPIVCTPGRQRCNPADNVRIEVCDESGTDWCCTGSCAVPQVDGVCFEGKCVSVCAVDEKSYLGCDYYAVDLDNAFVPCGQNDDGTWIYCDAAASQFAVVLSNPDTQQEVVYQITNAPAPDLPAEEECEPPEHIVKAGVLPPKGIEIIELPRRDVNGTVKAMRAYRIASNAPITAYQFNPLENVDVFSNDASLLLPTNTAGMRYYVMTREQTFDDLKSYVTVVGVTVEDATVTVVPTARTLAGPDIPVLEPGEAFTTVLQRYEVLNLETNFIGADLTGTLVSSDVPVVVFGGSEAANAPNTSRCDLTTNKCDWDKETNCECTQADGPNCSPHAKCHEFITCCADHLEQQMFPLSAWGTEYLAIRSMPRGTPQDPGQEKDVWRVLAAQDNTEVEVEPPIVTIPILGGGEWFEFETNEDFLITGTQPILVGQFLAAEHAPGPGYQEGDAGTGDPAFILVAPTRQFRDSYVFLAPNKYAEDYVSIGARVGTRPKLDGAEVDTLNPEETRLQINDIEGTSWRAYRVRIQDGFHVLTCAGTCSVMVHGYDQYVSYGYPGGLNLEDEDEL